MKKILFLLSIGITFLPSVAIAGDDELRDILRDSVVLAQAGNWNVSASYWQNHLNELDNDNNDVSDEHGLIYILGSIAYEKVDDAKAYQLWTKGLSFYLERGSSWELYQASLAEAIENVQYHLASSFSSDGVSISSQFKNALIYQSLNVHYGLTAYTGPRPGLKNKHDIADEPLTVARTYFPQARSVDYHNRSKNIDIDSASLPTTRSEESEQYSGLHRGFVGVNTTKRENISTSLENKVGTDVPLSYPSVGVDEVSLTKKNTINSLDLKNETNVVAATLNVDKAPVLVEALARRLSNDEYILSTDEKEVARIAWRYFENNRQSNTGLFNSVEGYPYTTMWDMGSSLAALASAYELDVINEDLFNKYLTTFLLTLKDMPLYKSKLPNREYDTRSALMTNLRNKVDRTGSGFSSIDIGRVLIWLHYIKENHEEFLPQVDSIINQWELSYTNDKQDFYREIILNENVDRKQEGRLGYEQYTAMAFSLMEIFADNAFDYEETEKVLVEDIEIIRDTRIPDYLNIEPFLLIALEFQNVPQDIYQQLSALLAAHQRRYERTSVPALYAEDSIDQSPWFLYNVISSKEGEWLCKNHRNKVNDKCQEISTKAAFIAYHLFDTDITEQAYQEIIKNSDHRKGFYAGIYENDTPNKVLTANTNALILESLAYKKRGNRSFVSNPDRYLQLQSRSRIAN